MQGVPIIMNFTNKYSLALDYHENSKFPLVAQTYDPKVQYKIYPNTRAIALEKNSYEKGHKKEDEFLRVILQRKSTRDFSRKNIDFDSLSRLLTLSFGLRSDDGKSIFRTYASAGRRFPVEVYAIVLRSDDMEKGIYHYNICDNKVEIIKSGDYSGEIIEFYANQSDLVTLDVPCVILFSLVLERSMGKYGERGYRFALLDAGHMSQNLYLVATYLNLGVVALGAGIENDEKLNELLSLCNRESAFYGFFVGHPQT